MLIDIKRVCLLGKIVRFDNLSGPRTLVFSISGAMFSLKELGQCGRMDPLIIIFGVPRQTPFQTFLTFLTLSLFLLCVSFIQLRGVNSLSCFSPLPEFDQVFQTKIQASPF
jgi:hypothetical protein